MNSSEELSLPRGEMPFVAKLFLLINCTRISGFADVYELCGDSHAYAWNSIFGKRSTGFIIGAHDELDSERKHVKMDIEVRCFSKSPTNSNVLMVLS
jgi:hypothetical protein